MNGKLYALGLIVSFKDADTQLPWDTGKTRRLAKELRVPAPRIQDIVLEKRGISADTALRLGRYFNMSARILDESAGSLPVAYRGESSGDGLDCAA